MDQRMPTRTVAQRIRTLRKRKDWSAEELAEAMRRVGIPWERGVVSKLEAGRREQISVDELLALAYVLDVAPMHLLVPLDDEAAKYRYIPTDESLNWMVRDWIRGRLPMPGQDKRIFFSEVPVNEHAVAEDLSRRLSEDGQTYDG